MRIRERSEGGRWQAANLGDRTYTLIWPPPIHTGTLAPDGQKFSGADHYGNQFATGKESCPDADLDDVAVQFNMMVSAGDGMAR